MRYLLLTSAVLALAAGHSGLAQTRTGAPGAPGGPSGQHGGASSAAAPTPAPGPAKPTGSFEASCRNIQVQGANVTAECHNIHNRYPVSTITFTACRGDLSNNNGVLSCPGATASVPPGQDDGSAPRKSNNDAQIAGAVLGALAGAGNPGPPPPPQPNAGYPVFGDQHYGDPAYDPRYRPQGWGFGHRPGEWVWIRDRADWLDRRVDRAVDAGAMSRREARELRRDLADLEDLENRYRRQGMAPWMREDLDRRFDALAERVRDVTTSDRGRYGDPPPPPSGYYGR